jgi:membrane protease YdiL (CAAX protease family)
MDGPPSRKRSEGAGGGASVTGNQVSSAFDSRPCALSKLIYVISVAIVAYGISLHVANGRFLELLRRHDLGGAIAAGRYSLPATFLIFLLIMVAVILAYRPVGQIFTWSPSARKSADTRATNIGYGIAGGLACFAVTVPIMWLRGGARAGFVSSTIVGIYGVSEVGALMLVLLAVALPIASEMVFRGVVLRTLSEYVSIPAAIVASAVLFAYCWPVLDWYESIIPGMICGLLYHRTRTLTASIIANAILSAGSGVLLILLGYR